MLYSRSMSPTNAASEEHAYEYNQHFLAVPNAVRAHLLQAIANYDGTEATLHKLLKHVTTEFCNVGYENGAAVKLEGSSKHKVSQEELKEDIEEFMAQYQLDDAYAALDLNTGLPVLNRPLGAGVKSNITQHGVGIALLSQFEPGTKVLVRGYTANSQTWALADSFEDSLVLIESTTKADHRGTGQKLDQMVDKDGMALTILSYDQKALPKHIVLLTPKEFKRKLAGPELGR